MAEALTLSSVHNPRVKQLLALRERREREKTQLFLIEGYRELLRATDAGWKVTTLFTCPSLYLGSNEGALIAQLKNQGTQVIHCSESVFHKISYRDRPDGLLAIAPQRHLTLQDLEKNCGLSSLYSCRSH